MKKILFITNVQVPYRMEFFRGIAKRNDLTVFFEAQTGKFQYNYDTDSSGFQSYFLKSKEEKKEWKTLFSLLNSRFDYIIVGGIASKLSMLAILYMKIKRIPYMISVDGAILRKDTIWKKILKTYLISSASGYLSSAQNADRYFMKYGADENNIYRYPFTSLSKDDILQRPLTDSEQQKLKRKLGFSEDEILILSVGRFIYRKGFDILLKAFSGLEDKSTLVIIGGKPTDEYNMIMMEEHLKNVKFLDFLTKEELVDYYCAADIFVLPTREEVWGLVINEAMAYGCPVITTDNCVAGMELVKCDVNGFLIPVDDFKELHCRLCELIQDKEKRKCMSENSLNIIKKYTIENMIESHIRIFDK